MGDVVDLHGQPAHLEDDLEFVADCCTIRREHTERSSRQEKIPLRRSYLGKPRQQRRARRDHRSRESPPDTGRQQQTGASTSAGRQAPDVLGGIMLDASASPKHRIDSAKALDAFAANGPEVSSATDRFVI